MWTRSEFKLVQVERTANQMPELRRVAQRCELRFKLLALELRLEDEGVEGSCNGFRDGLNLLSMISSAGIVEQNGRSRLATAIDGTIPAGGRF